MDARLSRRAFSRNWGPGWHRLGRGVRTAPGADAHGKATKVISALLASLPPKHKYRIIFMTRPVQEVVASQWVMLERRGTDPKSQRAHLEETQARHALEMLAALRQHPRVALLEMDYPALAADPARGAAQIAAFLGENLTTPEAMPAAVKPSLHRNRAT